MTVLVAVIAVFLAYNANNGLPFAPTLDVRVRAENSAAMTKGSEVREGGVRIGVVRTIRTVRLPSGKAGAEMAVTIEGSGDDLPVDSSFTIRPRSPLGLKYLELVRGSSDRVARDGHVFATDQTTIPVQIDDFARTFDGRTRTGVQRNIQGFGNALAGRGQSVNTSDRPAAARCSATWRRSRATCPTAARAWDASSARSATTARVVAPVADTQADLFTRTAITFEAISADTDALKETISRSHPAFQAGIDSFPVQRPFLTDSAALAREMQPVARDLRPALPADQRRDRDRHPGHAPLGALLRRPEAHARVAARAGARPRAPGSPCAG